MPSFSTQYTPFESLLFLQSVVRNGAEPLSLSRISRSLNTNPSVQSDEKYDAQRLAPEALKILYDELIKEEESDESLPVNGYNAEDESNTPKHKLSVSPEPSSRSGDNVFQASHMLDRFHARYTDRIIQEVKDEEKKYRALVAEIQVLEEGMKASQETHGPVVEKELSASGRLSSPIGGRPVSPVQDGSVSAATSAGGGTPSKDARSKEELAWPAESKPPNLPPGQMLPPQTPGSETSIPQSPSAAAAIQRQSTPGSRVSPVPSNGVTTVHTHQPSQSFPARYGPIQPPFPLPPTTSPRSENALPPISSIVAQAPPLKASPAQRKTSGSVPSRTSPLLPSPSPPYLQQSPYGYPYPAWPQYSSPNSPYANPQFYHQQPLPRNIPPAQTPVYNHHPPYHHPVPPNQYGPGPYPRPPMPAQPLQYVEFPWPAQPASAFTTPSVKAPGDRPSGVRASGTSTPWTAGGVRRGSPERPVRERDVSPLSDQAASPETAQNDARDVKRKTVSKGTPPKAVLKRGRARNVHGARAGSTHSSALASRSRSQSLASMTSESRLERAIDARTSVRKIKHEVPSTPAPLLSDNEQRSSGRRRGRSDGLQPLQPFGYRPDDKKRKRESGPGPSPSPSLPTPLPFGSRIRPRLEPVDPSLVAITKNFARKAAPILNDVNAHKVAGIFAKPLTEREAPCYKDLIYRPQDLKSIRAAVVRGSRAANAVIDEIENGAGKGGSESPAAAPKATTTQPSGSLLVNRTEDLSPPKGIVNSAQLEMEFMRIFANAVMFNPLPPSESGLAPGLKMEIDGISSRYRSRKSKSDDDDSDDDVEKKGYVQEEEGSIINDTREMFESVEKAVQQWRRVEQGYVEDVPRSSAGIGRGGSVSASDALADESAQEEADLAQSINKRRRLME